MGCAASNSRHSKRPCIHESYAFDKKLGQGAFGQVRACVQRKTQLNCAVKIIDIDANRTMRSEAIAEGMIWKRVTNHQNVVSLLETYVDNDFHYFVMERCECSLYDQLLRKEVLQEVDLMMTFRQMLLGLEACHSKHIVHRDVKPANFLVGMDGCLKICDFGLADLECPKGLCGTAGSPPFMSPEMVQLRRYSRRTDLWSLGVTAYLMLYGQYPYHPKTHSVELVKRAIATNTPRPAYEPAKGLSAPSQDARNFVHVLLSRDPINRPSAGECLDFPVLNDKTSRTGACFGAAVVLAKQKTVEFDTPVDPTVAKTIDELIKQLQQQGKRAASSFSLPSSGEKSLTLTDTAGTLSRHFSHGGELSHTLAFPRTDATLSRHFSHGGELTHALGYHGDEWSECSTSATTSTTSFSL